MFELITRPETRRDPVGWDQQVDTTGHPQNQE